MRRLERRLQVNGIDSLPNYRAHLEAHPSETSSLLQDLLISVTSFFRDAEAFDALAGQLDAAVFNAAADAAPQKIRAWVAGCATGEEAYSVAMQLTEQSMARHLEPDIQVFATDIDERAITIARTGLYPGQIVNDVAPSRRLQFFTKEQGQVRVGKELRERVTFSAHNILRDPPISNLDLVCCRNLLIYLDRSVQRRVLEIFHFALRPGGLLFLGSSETADATADLFVAVDVKQRIYRARGEFHASQARAPASSDRAAPRRAACHQIAWGDSCRGTRRPACAYACGMVAAERY